MSMNYFRFLMLAVLFCGMPFSVWGMEEKVDQVKAVQEKLSKMNIVEQKFKDDEEESKDSGFSIIQQTMRKVIGDWHDTIQKQLELLDMPQEVFEETCSGQ